MSKPGRPILTRLGLVDLPAGVLSSGRQWTGRRRGTVAPEYCMAARTSMRSLLLRGHCQYVELTGGPVVALTVGDSERSGVSSHTPLLPLPSRRPLLVAPFSSPRCHRPVLTALCSRPPPSAHAPPFRSQTAEPLASRRQLAGLCACGAAVGSQVKLPFPKHELYFCLLVST